VLPPFLAIEAVLRRLRGHDAAGASFNRQHLFVEVLFSDITESGEALRSN
jgi:hypothetical protein